MGAKDYPWMLYGATGRSGELIARKAVARGFRPVLAGRDARMVRKIAEELDLPWRAFEMGDWGKFRREISSVSLLVNAAGPLLQTSVLVAESCLTARTHYFDLTNQIPSLVAMYTLDAEAKEKNLTLLPGLALSPAASNCLVKHLHTLLPEADSVDIALDPFIKTYMPGANLTVAENIIHGGFVRRNGVLERSWFGSRLVDMKSPTGSRTLLTAALGDVEAAYRCTRLPDITTYIVAEVPLSVDRHWEAPPLSTLCPFAEPTSEDLSNRENNRCSIVWVRMSKLGEKSLEGWLQFGEGREFSADVVVAGVSRLASDNELCTGAHTAATALGSDFILELPDVKRVVSSSDTKLQV